MKVIKIYNQKLIKDLRGFYDIYNGLIFMAEFNLGIDNKHYVFHSEYCKKDYRCLINNKDLKNLKFIKDTISIEINIKEDSNIYNLINI
jgi:hypothetical protein